jgi:hypothetical protein
MAPAIIYGLVDPRTRLIRYVGKSTSGLRRPRRHRRECAGKTHRERWIAQLRCAGLDYEIAVLEVSPADLALAERWWIAFGRASGWPLTNLTDGGDGAPGRVISEETAAKRSASLRSYYSAPESRTKLSDAVKASLASPSVRAKLSANARAQMSDPTARDHLRAIAASRSSATREKLRRSSASAWTSARRADTSARMTGKKLSPETRAKISATKSGRPWSESRRAAQESRA